MLRQRLAYSYNRFYMRWTSIIHMATDSLISLRLSSRPPSPKDSATTLSKNQYWYLSRPTFWPLEAARPPTRKLGQKRKSINLWINSETRIEKTLASLLLPVLTVGLEMTCLRLCALTVARKGITQGTALSPERIYQKTSISLGNFNPNNWR